MSCSNYLQHIKEEIQLALCSDATAQQIADVVRETLKEEADKYRESAKKATDALDFLKVPYQYAVPDYMSYPSSPITFSKGDGSRVAFDGPVGATGLDTITL